MQVFQVSASSIDQPIVFIVRAHEFQHIQKFVQVLNRASQHDFTREIWIFFFFLLLTFSLRSFFSFIETYVDFCRNIGDTLPRQRSRSRWDVK